MAKFLEAIEGKINEYMKPKNKEDITEKTFSQVESLVGIPRERMVSMGVAMLAIYFLLGNFLPLFSHIICTIYPLKESFKILRKQAQPTENILLYWILYSIVSLFDFSFLTSIPFYYFVKIGIFLSITSNGVEKLKEWSEPTLKFAESWVLIASSAVEQKDQ